MAIAFVKRAAELWRRYTVDNVPASGEHRPIKADIVTWGGKIEQTLDALKTAAYVNTGTSATNVPLVSQADVRYSAAAHVHNAATTSVAGFMSGADKAKLNGLNAASYVATSGDGTISGYLDGYGFRTKNAGSAADPSLQLDYDAGGVSGFYGGGGGVIGCSVAGVVAARIDVAGPNVVASQTIITVEKGDARYLVESNNLSDLTSASTARTNLGLDTMATRSAGTSAFAFRDNVSNDARFAALADAWPGVYSGTNVNNITFPIGTPLVLNSRNRPRNSTVVPRLAPNPAQYIDSGTGSILTGVWAMRGDTIYDDHGQLIQRIS